MNYYVLEIIGDIEPVLHGPYKTTAMRDKIAKRLRYNREQESGLYPLDVTKGAKVTVDSYSGGFFQ